MAKIKKVKNFKNEFHRLDALIKSDIKFIKNFAVKKKVDYDEFAALERRVLLLEKRR